MTVEIVFENVQLNLSGWHNEMLSQAAQNAPSDSPVGSIRDANIRKEGDTLIIEVDGKLADLSEDAESNLLSAVFDHTPTAVHTETREGDQS